MRSVIPVGLLLVALVVLATLQYQWIGQITQIERQKLEANLINSSNRFAQDFAAERERLYGALESRYRYSGDLSTLIARHREWKQIALHPNLVKTLYVADAETPGGTTLRLRQIYPDQEATEPVQWPGDLTNLEIALEREPDLPRGPYGPTPLRYRPKPGEAMVLAIAMTGTLQPHERRPSQQRLDPRLLVTRGPEPGRSRWVIARLDRTVMTGEILPALADRHFPRNHGQGYRLAVVDIDDNMNPVYTTPSAWSKADLETYDYAIDLFVHSVFQSPRPRTVSTTSRGGLGAERGGRPPGQGRDSPGAPSGLSWQFEVPGLKQVDAPLGHRWRLLVKNEAGSLEAAVEHLRLRSLGVSFGVLLVLFGAASTMVYSGRRARALGRLQMEFAAGVSHELRTPLTVIQAAAHNLQSGLIRDPQNVERYGKLVQKEARRLSGMVEQVMAYTETQSGRRRYDITAVEITDIVDQALKSLVFVDNIEVKVERRIPSGLPPAKTDPVAILQCLQNLISNAVKYGGRAGLVELEIKAVSDPANHCIRLSVMDRGSGVPAKDLPHLFDAFYRGSNVSVGTPGNGIGLHLVRKTIEAQSGSVAYAARLGGGAVFTLTIPSVESRA